MESKACLSLVCDHAFVVNLSGFWALTCVDQMAKDDKCEQAQWKCGQVSGYVCDGTVHEFECAQKGSGCDGMMARCVCECACVGATKWQRPKWQRGAVVVFRFAKNTFRIVSGFTKTYFVTFIFAGNTFRTVFGFTNIYFVTCPFAENMFRDVSGFTKIDFVTCPFADRFLTFPFPVLWKSIS